MESPSWCDVLCKVGHPRENAPKCNVDTYAEVGWFRPPKISKDMSTGKPIKRAYFQPRRQGEENFRPYTSRTHKLCRSRSRSGQSGRSKTTMHQVSALSYDLVSVRARMRMHEHVHVCLCTSYVICSTYWLFAEGGKFGLALRPPVSADSRPLHTGSGRVGRTSWGSCRARN